jgi:hypothetical protein
MATKCHEETFVNGRFMSMSMAEKKFGNGAKMVSQFFKSSIISVKQISCHDNQNCKNFLPIMIYILLAGAKGLVPWCVK